MLEDFDAKPRCHAKEVVIGLLQAMSAYAAIKYSMVFVLECVQC